MTNRLASKRARVEFSRGRIVNAKNSLIYYFWQPVAANHIYGCHSSAALRLTDQCPFRFCCPSLSCWTSLDGDLAPNWRPRSAAITASHNWRLGTSIANPINCVSNRGKSKVSSNRVVETLYWAFRWRRKVQHALFYEKLKMEPYL